MFIIMNTILDYIPRVDLDTTMIKLSTKINENLTMVKNIMVSNEPFDVYLVNIISSVVIVVVSYIIVLYFEKSKSKTAINNISYNDIANDTANDTANTIAKLDNGIKHKIIIVKPLCPRRGLYLESVVEFNNNVKLENIKLGSVYTVLLRVQMKRPFHIGRVGYELHGNNTNLKQGITQDMYMSFNMCFTNLQENAKNTNTYDLGKYIVNAMNYFNNNGNEYCKTNDFIIIAIGENTNKDAMTLQIGDNSGVNNVEFYNALIAKGYNMNNYYDFRLLINEKFKIYKNFNLMLPIHEVYDIFMDVYNNSLFETKKYAMDDDNYESWNGVSINQIKF